MLFHRLSHPTKKNIPEEAELLNVSLVKRLKTIDGLGVEIQPKGDSQRSRMMLSVKPQTLGLYQEKD